MGLNCTLLNKTRIGATTHTGEPCPSLLSLVLEGLTIALASGSKRRLLVASLASVYADMQKTIETHAGQGCS
eukprot:1922218-Amphidinium_carterae.1